MRYAAKKDGNHAELRKQCAGLGISWQDIAPSKGGGQPDALLGWRGRNRIVEIKDPEASNTDRKLRPNQVAWARAWQGEKPVKVETLAEIVALFTSSGESPAGVHPSRAW